MSANLSFFKSETSQRLRAEGRAEGRVEGRAEGEVKMAAEKVLRLLQAREISVSADAEQRIRSCRDLAILDEWFDRAITATTISEIFA
ncbi:hypothetical protein [Nocardia jiangxiensis]|uniref:DUF4351 domain-containing protein n=1 Tax=Nocardia jiangxiensis TaxID=282685 RepID=A0ABW6RTW8_9NOCA|nr:hypothetical protein [Nocardia jiangxiensis]